MLEPASILQRDVDVKAKASEQVEGGGICTMDRTAMANKSTYELVPQPRSCLLLFASFFSCCCAFCHAIIMISVPQQHLANYLFLYSSFLFNHGGVLCVASSPILRYD